LFLRNWSGRFTFAETLIPLCRCFLRGAALALTLVLALWGTELGALDFGVRAKPYVSIPFGSAFSVDNFTTGGGVDAAFDVDVSSVLPNPLDIGYTAGIEGGLNMVPLYKAGDMSQFYSGGLGAGLFYYPLSRLAIRLDGVIGLYQSSFKGNTYSNLFGRYGLEAGFRFSPRFTLSVNTGYRFNAPNYTGLYAGLTGQIVFGTAGGSGGIVVDLMQDEAVFPVFSPLYRQNRIGILRITNRESAEIRNVRVSFQAGNYTSSRLLCGEQPRIRKRGSVEIPLYADFSPSIYNFSESGRIPGQVIIEYELLGSGRSANGTAVVEVHNRNSFRWNDPRSLAVFVSPSAPEVLDYSKYIVGIARNHLRTGLNRNMQFAVFLYEGLRAGGILSAPDVETPYAASRGNPEAVDYLQFPFQTLAYRSGDVDDLGLLYAASLEAAGIGAALIPLADDFVVAFSLGIGEEEAAGFFDNMDNLLILNGEAWLPVSFGPFREGFVNGWYSAVNAIGGVLAAGGNPDVIMLQETWKSYPPAALSVQEAQFDKPPEDNVVRLVETGMLRYIAAEFGPKIRRVREAIAAGRGSPDLYNQLGLFYIRSGMYEEAKAEYRRSAAMGSVPAMVNLGNLAYMERDMETASRWYGQALTVDPANRVAANGLNQIALDKLE
jgi:tetratricopeptide (TPR) repeat protein